MKFREQGRSFGNKEEVSEIRQKFGNMEVILEVRKKLLKT